MRKYWWEIGFRVAAALWFIASSVLAIDSIKGASGWDSKGFAWEFLKTVIGPFLGAALAFYVNDFVHKQRERNAQKVAIFGAAFALRAMYRDFYNYRFGFRSSMAGLQANYANDPHGEAPVWAFAKPIFYVFNTANLPNLTALQFLLEHSDGRKAFAALQELELSYIELANLQQLYNESADAVQSKLEGLPSQSWGEDEAAIGKKIAAKARDHLVAVVIRIGQAEGEHYYVEAFQKLQAATKHHFKGEESLGFLNLADPDAASQLPPIPPKVAAHVESMTKASK